MSPWKKARSKSADPGKNAVVRSSGADRTGGSTMRNQPWTNARARTDARLPTVGQDGTDASTVSLLRSGTTATGADAASGARKPIPS
jgi:hypothetical protein